MAITAQSGTASNYMTLTHRGDPTMPSRAHTVAVILGVLAIVLVVGSAIAGIVDLRHLAVAMVSSSAVVAALAGMMAALDVARTHRK